MPSAAWERDWLLANKAAHGSLAPIVRRLAQPASSNDANAPANPQHKKNQGGLLHCEALVLGQVVVEKDKNHSPGKAAEETLQYN